jgi:hypothetical protein
MKSNSCMEGIYFSGMKIADLGFETHGLNYRGSAFMFVLYIFK